MASIIQIVGTSGSGKGELSHKVADYVQHRGYSVKSFIEPGPLRDFILEQREKRKLNPETLTTLFTADRMITYFRDVIPYMSDLKTVFVSDRGLPDTIVYQGIIGGVSIEEILKYNKSIPAANLILCLTVDGQTGYNRIKARCELTGKPISPNESPQKLDLFAKAYSQIPSILPNVISIDTTEINEDEVFYRAKEHVDKLL